MFVEFSFVNGLFYIFGNDVVCIFLVFEDNVFVEEIDFLESRFLVMG